jgi:beta-lactam-binding protein with PASTA domain
VSTGDTPERPRVEASDLIGRVIDDRYALARLVSSGANTTIYDGVDQTTGRLVTVKLLRPSIAASPSFRERFDADMRAVSALSHANIAALYDWGLAPVGDVSTAFVVSESLVGGSLRDMFDRGRRLTPSQALVVGLDACRGLDYAHRRGFVHTELTPSKLVFGDDRRLRIADFGLARLLGEPIWENPEAVANHVAGYAAPEQGAGSELDGRTDVYALCLSLHEAVTGVLPFKTDSTVATLAARVGRLMPVSADLGPLAAVFERAGRPEMTERATAAEFGKGLVQAAAKLPRPEPLPLLSTGLFDTPTEQLRDPDDPTGGVHRPAGGAAPVVVVPATPESDGTIDDAQASGDDAHDGSAAGAAAGVVAGAAGAIVVGASDPDVGAGTPDADDGEPGGTAAEDDSTAADGVADDPGDPDPDVDDATDGVDDLMILPVDSELDGGPDATLPEPGPIPVAGGLVAADGLTITPDPSRDALPPTTQFPTTPAPQSAAPTRRRGMPWKLVLATLLAAALIVLGVLASRIFQTPEYIVPDLVATPEAEARNLIAPNDWELSVERERNDTIDVVGQVIRTVPSSGVSLAEGEPFLMVVSEGPTLREIPDSTGLPLAEAQKQLTDRGLAVEAVEEFDEEVPVGSVVSWTVPGDPTLTTGALVLPDTVVQLVVSQGPAPRSVPNITGVPLSQAQAAVAEVQLAVAEERQDFSDTVPVGNVISQSPQPGTEVERGATVTVVVSRGPDLVTFPDLSTVPTYEAAAQILRDAGFEPVLTFGDSQGAIQTVTIDGAAPTPGTTYRRGTRVEITALAP